jgi:3-phosphoglycerate kinase
MIIVGGMAFTFLKVINGINIGSSLYDEEVQHYYFDSNVQVFRAPK